MTPGRFHWRIAAEGLQYRAICVRCDWQCPVTARSGAAAADAARTLHTTCARGVRLPERRLTAVAS